MYYQHDWFMLQIQMMVQFIAKVTFQKDPFEIDALFDTEWGHTETDPLEKEIAALFAQSRFQEAESLVLKRLSSKQPAALKTALSFYNALNQLPDERLNAHGFPREPEYGCPPWSPRRRPPRKACRPPPGCFPCRPPPFGTASF